MFFSLDISVTIRRGSIFTLSFQFNRYIYIQQPSQHMSWERQIIKSINAEVKSVCKNLLFDLSCVDFNLYNDFVVLFICIYHLK